MPPSPLTTTDRIALRQVKIDCILGVYAHERTTPQRVELDLSMYFDTRKAGKSGALSDTLDYAKVLAIVQTVLKEGRFKMLESAAQAIVDALYAAVGPMPIELSIRKPDVLGGAAIPEVTIFRSAPSQP